jgi:hypothetical protein
LVCKAAGALDSGKRENIETLKEREELLCNELLKTQFFLFLFAILKD